MNDFLSRCFDFILTTLILFIFFVCIIVTFAVCYTFPNLGIVAGVAALVVAIISQITNKKLK